jgi:hypothetical protein
MDSQIIFALVIAVLFLGSIVWLIIYARREENKRKKQDTKDSESERSNRAA